LIAALPAAEQQGCLAQDLESDIECHICAPRLDDRQGKPIRPVPSRSPRG
jgi:hypothetical protein